jgi:hypothetical protein
MDHQIWQSIDRLAVIVGRLDGNGLQNIRVHSFPIDLDRRLIGFISEKDAVTSGRFFTLSESRSDEFDISKDQEIKLDPNNVVQIMHRPVIPKMYYCIPIDRVLACMKVDCRLYAANRWKSYLIDGVFGLETLQRLYALMQRGAFSNTPVDTDVDDAYSYLKNFGESEQESERDGSARIAAETKGWLSGTDGHVHPAWEPSALRRVPT